MKEKLMRSALHRGHVFSLYRSPLGTSNPIFEGPAVVGHMNFMHALFSIVLLG